MATGSDSLRAWHFDGSSANGALVQGGASEDITIRALKTQAEDYADYTVSEVDEVSHCRCPALPACLGSVLFVLPQLSSCFHACRPTTGSYLECPWRSSCTACPLTRSRAHDKLNFGTERIIACPV